MKSLITLIKRSKSAASILSFLFGCFLLFCSKEHNVIFTFAALATFYYLVKAVVLIYVELKHQVVELGE